MVQHPHHVHPLTPLITYSNEHFTPGNPPPHLQTDVDPKTGRKNSHMHIQSIEVMALLIQNPPQMHDNISLKAKVKRPVY